MEAITRGLNPRTLIVGALLTALTALGQISTSIYIPSMPAIVRDLATTPDRVNGTLSGFLFGFAVFQLVFGPASDRLGRRPVLLAGLAFYVGASVLCAVAGSIEVLILGRVLQGMAACCGPVLGRAIVRDVYGPAETAAAMAWISAALAVSPAVAPIIGGYLQVWFGWRAAFVVLATGGAVLIAASWFLLRETRPRPDGSGGQPPGLLEAGRVLAGDRCYVGYTLAVACVFAGLMAFAAGGPFVFIEQLGLSPERYGMLAVFTVAGYLIGSVSAGRLARRMPLERLVAIGIALALAGGGAMLLLAWAAPPSVIYAIAPMAVFTAGIGVVLPLGMAGAMAHFPRIAGAASALLGFVQMMIAGLAALAVGLLPAVSALPMAAVIAACALLAAVSFTALVRPHSSRRR